MPEKTWGKAIDTTQEKVKVKSIDLVLTGMIIIALVTVFAWVSLFLTFGRNIEQLKVEVSKTNAEIRHINEQVHIMDRQIENYSEVLLFLEKYK